jgi:hypothetical protein
MGEFVDFLEEGRCGKIKKKKKKREREKRPQTAKKCHNTFDDRAEENKTQGRQGKKTKVSLVSIQCLGQGMNSLASQMGDTYHIIEEIKLFIV